jgi:hypothetical protein
LDRSKIKLLQLNLWEKKRVEVCCIVLTCGVIKNLFSVKKYECRKSASRTWGFLHTGTLRLDVDIYIYTIILYLYFNIKNQHLNPIKKSGV